MLDTSLYRAVRNGSLIGANEERSGLGDQGPRRSTSTDTSTSSATRIFQLQNNNTMVDNSVAAAERYHKLGYTSFVPVHCCNNDFK